MEAYVKYHKEGSIGILEFGNPAGNSLPSPLLKDLKASLIALEKDAEVRVILLQWKSSLLWRSLSSRDEDPKNLRRGNRLFYGLCGSHQSDTRVRTLTKFVIGRVQGKVVGRRCWAGRSL